MSESRDLVRLAKFILGASLFLERMMEVKEY
jgi:hypothetical protein